MNSTKPKPFPARWACTCVFCKQPVRVGDFIHWNRYTKGQTAHYKCADEKDFSYGSVMGVKSHTPVNADIPSDAPVSTPISGNDSLAEAIVSAVLPKIEERFKIHSNLEELIDSKVIDALSLLDSPKRIEVLDPKTSEVKDLGIQHKQFEDLFYAVQAVDKDGLRLNGFLKGGPGTGKTKAAEMLAKGLGPEWKCVIIPSIFDATIQIFGYRQPDGTVLRTAFRDGWEYGKTVICIDEFDGSIPNEGIKLNAPLANGSCLFPDGMVPRHKDCIILVNGNTYGYGATSEFVGRCKLDAATLNRFFFIDWELDEGLENATTPNKEWTKRVQSVRAKVASKGIKVLITPRASYYGAALLATGLSQEKVEQMVLRQGMTSEQWESVK